MPPLAIFHNVSEHPDREFVLNLTVGWTIYEAGSVSAMYIAEDIPFVFDTGADATLLMQGLAMHIQLAGLSGETVFVRGIKGVLKAKETKVKIQLGKEWIVVACLVPSDGDSIDSNLLGMAGLLEKYRFVLEREKLEIWEREQGAPP